MATVNEGDMAVARRIYGAYGEAVAVKCVGCIAGIIAEYREELTAAARLQVLVKGYDHDD